MDPDCSWSSWRGGPEQTSSLPEVHCTRSAGLGWRPQVLGPFTLAITYMNAATPPTSSRVLTVSIAVVLGLAAFPTHSFAAAGGATASLSTVARAPPGRELQGVRMPPSALRAAGGRVLRTPLAWAAPLAPGRLGTPSGLHSTFAKAFVGKGSLGMMHPRSAARMIPLLRTRMSAAADVAADVEPGTESAKYPFPDIEKKWQEIWKERQTFRTEPDCDRSKPKFYALDMFPYPSGAGLHVGHPEGYTATDILCRYKRMTGHNVMHPMGWDAFGLPAEQYAIQTGTHPAVTTEKNINRFREQVRLCT